MDEKQWYFRAGEQEHGPIDSEAFIDAYLEGSIELSSLVRREDQSGWVEARQIGGLAQKAKLRQRQLELAEAKTHRQEQVDRIAEPASVPESARRRSTTAPATQKRWSESPAVFWGIAAAIVFVMFSGLAGLIALTSQSGDDDVASDRSGDNASESEGDEEQAEHKGRGSRSTLPRRQIASRADLHRRFDQSIPDTKPFELIETGVRFDTTWLADQNSSMIFAFTGNGDRIEFATIAIPVDSLLEPASSNYATDGADRFFIAVSIMMNAIDPSLDGAAHDWIDQNISFVSITGNPVVDQLNEEYQAVLEIDDFNEGTPYVIFEVTANE